MAGERIVTGIYGMLLFAGILVVFAILMNYTMREYRQQLTGEARDLTVNTTILTYLRSPITIAGERMIMADALARAAATGDFTPLHADIKTFLEQLPKPHPVSGWRYRLERVADGEELDEVYTIDIIGWYEAKRVRYLIPSYVPGEQLRVTFALECQDAGCYA